MNDKKLTYYVILDSYTSNDRLAARRFLTKYDFIELTPRLYVLYAKTDVSIWDYLEKLLTRLQFRNVHFTLVETTTHRRQAFEGVARYGC